MFLNEFAKDFWKILIIDDEPVARHLLRSLLVNAGYTNVEQVENGEQAVEQLQQKSWHLVLCDKNLPGIDGLEVLSQGKQLQPMCDFIIITAYGSLETALMSFDLGACDYLTKPFPQINILLQRIEKALSRQAEAIQHKNLVSQIQSLLQETDTPAQEKTDKIAQLFNRLQDWQQPPKRNPH